MAPGGRLVVVPAGGEIADEIEQIIRPMSEALRPKRDSPAQLVAVAEGAGLRVVETARTGDGVWHTSPNQHADEIEARSWSSLWDLPADVWDAVVLPAVAALRALPEPDRPRHRSGHFDVVVFEPA